jgi:hypothetical protein
LSGFAVVAGERVRGFLLKVGHRLPSCRGSRIWALAFYSRLVGLPELFAQVMFADLAGAGFG